MWILQGNKLLSPLFVLLIFVICKSSKISREHYLTMSHAYPKEKQNIYLAVEIVLIKAKPISFFCPLSHIKFHKSRDHIPVNPTQLLATETSDHRVASSNSRQTYAIF